MGIRSGLDSPYPARTRQAAREVNGVKTDVTSISFSDRIMITITQQGRLAQWVGAQSFCPAFLSDQNEDNRSSTE